VGKKERSQSRAGGGKGEEELMNVMEWVKDKKRSRWKTWNNGKSAREKGHKKQEGRGVSEGTGADKRARLDWGRTLCVYKSRGNTAHLHPARPCLL
jgi:hypothetical protein